MTGRRGFTLLELLVTVAIIAVLMSIGLGVMVRFSRKDELEATTNRVRALLRRARNASQEERFATRVELDPVRSELRAQLRTTVTRFRFEDVPQPAPNATETPPAFALQGALSFSMDVTGGTPGAGRWGNGLAFERPGAWARVEDRPVLSPAEGLWVEVWVYLGRLEDALPAKRDAPRQRDVDAALAAAGAPATPPSPRLADWRKKSPDDPPRFVIARKGRAWSIAALADRSLEVQLAGPDSTGVEVTFVARTAENTLKPLRWHRVVLAFDGTRSQVQVDGIPRVHHGLVGKDKLPGGLLRDPAPLILSDPHPDATLLGVVDELHVAVIHDAQRVPIPQNITLVASDDAVGFDVLGQLDTARHAEPVTIYLTDDERADELLAPPADDGKTKTRAEAASIVAGQAPFDRFADAAKAGKLDAGRVRSIVVERTGLVQ